MENDQKFKRSWEHRRPDMQDPSASGYDQSLANIALAAGWSDQEIANLMIAHRRKYGEDLTGCGRKVRRSAAVYGASTVSAAFGM